MRRIELDGRFEDRKGQQFVSGRGGYADAWTNIHRIETHGLASVPVKGAKGLVLPMPGNPDQAYILGGEHPGLRPSGLPAGGTAIYDEHGNIIRLFLADGISIDVAGAAFTVRKGGVTLTISGSGVAIEGDVTITGNVTVSGSVVDGDGNNGA